MLAQWSLLTMSQSSHMNSVHLIFLWMNIFCYMATNSHPLHLRMKMKIRFVIVNWNAYNSICNASLRNWDFVNICWEMFAMNLLLSFRVVTVVHYFITKYAFLRSFGFLAFRQVVEVRSYSLLGQHRMMELAKIYLIIKLCSGSKILAQFIFAFPNAVCTIY